MKIAHIGNMAQNAYLNARFQRAYGIEADSFDGGAILWQSPAWEDAPDIHPGKLSDRIFIPDPTFCLTDYTTWSRPPFAKILGYNHNFPAWYDTQHEFELHWHEKFRQQEKVLNYSVPTPRLQEHETTTMALYLKQWQAIQVLTHIYDMIVLYGFHVTNGITIPMHHPYLTFEHGTAHNIVAPVMERELFHFGHKYADMNIVTNTNMIPIFQEHQFPYTFMPHPVDTEKFCYQAPSQDNTFTIFVPARHVQPSHIMPGKANRTAIAGLHQFVQNHKHERIQIIMITWGLNHDIQTSKKLCQQLELDEYIHWWPCPLPKMSLPTVYKTADVVLDQFSHGAFGTTTIEALASGRPVITYINPAQVLLGYEKIPPVLNAQTPQEIAQWLEYVYTYPGRHGDEARTWIDRYHSWKHVTEKHIALYTTVLKGASHVYPRRPGRDA